MNSTNARQIRLTMDCMALSHFEEILGNSEYNYNSVVITVFNWGILDFSVAFFMITLSSTSQGLMSSNVGLLVCFTGM